MMANRLAALCVLLGTAAAYITCPQTAGGYCPDRNTCCAGGCLADEFAGNGTCCAGAAPGTPPTGCAHGYACKSSSSGATCAAAEPAKHPLAKCTPRYALCAPGASLKAVHGQAMSGTSEQLAYYNFSGAGPATEVAALVIVVHGADRNADDYFCAAVAAAALQTALPAARVAVLAPRFLEPQDGPVALEGGGTALRWNGSDSNGVWRYGADALVAQYGDWAVSSYAAMDALVDGARRAYPALKRITLLGHSSGGQFVQRYALTSSSAAFAAAPKLECRVVVANPSSFAYLDGRRYIGTPPKLTTPAAGSCPGYNQYEYGLAPGPELSASPYVAKAIAAGGVAALAKAYAARDVVYLAGGADVCNVTTGWCESHGLETTCSDELQGKWRLQRAQQYFSFLQAFYAPAKLGHRLSVVPGVGHDHSLMFTSKSGLGAIFGASVNAL